MTTITVHDKEEDREIKMSAVDARHAIAADPERYSEVHREQVARKSGDLESRLSAIEARLDALEEHDAPEPAPALPAVDEELE